MRSYLVLTAIGPDRPGIVDAVSRYVLDRGCNIEESRMAILGGEFAIIVLLSGEPPGIGRVQDEIGTLEAQAKLAVALKETTAQEARPAPPHVPYVITAVAMDHPGIVHGVAHALASLGVNVASLETRTANAPVSGTPIFSMRMDVEVPADLAISLLRAELAEIGEAHKIDITLQAKPT